MTIFVILFLVLFLVFIVQIIKLLFLAIKKKELSKEVKKAQIVFLCSVFVLILAGMTVPENVKNATKKEEELKKKAKEDKEENKKEIKYEILLESSYINKTGSNKRSIDVLIPSCDINKNEMYKILIPKLSKYAEGYNSLWITFYCDKRFFEIKRNTNGMVKLLGDKNIDVDSIKFHKTKELMSDKEISIYTEYQLLTGTSRNSTDEERQKFEEEKRNILKKYNITEEELMEINSKGFSFTL